MPLLVPFLITENMTATHMGLYPALESMILRTNKGIPPRLNMTTAKLLSGPFSLPGTWYNEAITQMHRVRDVASSMASTLIVGNYTGPHTKSNSNNTTNPISDGSELEFGSHTDDKSFQDVTLTLLMVALMMMFVVGLVAIAFQASHFVHRHGYARDTNITVRESRGPRRGRRSSTQGLLRASHGSSTRYNYAFDIDIEASRDMARESDLEIEYDAADTRIVKISVPDYGACLPSP